MFMSDYCFYVPVNSQVLFATRNRDEAISFALALHRSCNVHHVISVYMTPIPPEFVGPLFDSTCVNEWRKVSEDIVVSFFDEAN